MGISKTVLFQDCKCGARNEVYSGQAGFDLTCHECNKTFLADSLAKLKTRDSQRIAIDSGDQVQLPVRFRIKDLLICTIVFSVLSAIAVQIGVARLSVGIVLATIVVVFAVFGATLVHFQEAIRGKFWDIIQRK